MNHHSVVEVLLWFAVAVAWLSSVGLACMRNAFERLHYTAPIATLSSIAAGAAVLITEPFSQAGAKVILIILLLLANNAILTHATASAARMRSAGGDPQPNGSKKPRGKR